MCMVVVVVVCLCVCVCVCVCVWWLGNIEVRASPVCVAVVLGRSEPHLRECMVVVVVVVVV